MRKRGIFWLTLLALALFAVPAMAGTTDDVVVSFTVGDIFDITLTDGSWTPTVGLDEIDAGYVESLGEETLTYKTNKAFDITVYRTDGTNWEDTWTLAAKDNKLYTAYVTIPEGIANKVDYCTGKDAGEDSCTMDWKLSGFTFVNTPAKTYSTTVTFTIESAY